MKQLCSIYHTTLMVINRSVLFDNHPSEVILNNTYHPAQNEGFTNSLDAL